MHNHFISYPKSGRSWVRFALALLGHGNDIVFHHDGFEFNDGNLPALDFDMARRRLQYASPCRPVYLTRDPRDIIVSLYHQVTGRFQDFFNYQGDISAFIRDDYFGAANLQQFQSMWEQLCADGLALRISYEDCHADFETVLQQLIDYYGYKSSTEEIASAVRFSTFDNMQQLERSGEFPEPWLRLRNGAPKVRKGKVGGYRDVLQKKDVIYLDTIFSTHTPTSIAAGGGK